MVQISSKNPNILTQYSTLPPILPILNYYHNIDLNLINIKNSIQEIMINSVSQIFEENKIIKLDTILKAFQEIKKDIDEDSIIQKQEVEDIVEGMEELKDIKDKISDLHNNIKSITQTKFADLIKTINTLKADLVGNIKKKEIISLVDQLFKEKFDNMVGEFTNNLHDLIEKEFEKISKPVDNTSEIIFQYRNDFKMLLLNMLTNFETKMNSIYDLLKDNAENLSAAIKIVETKIANSLNTIIQNSINEVSNLNKPIENVMKEYLHEISIVEKPTFYNIWVINSVTRINDIIQNLIANSKENLTIIIPHIENHIAIEQFEKIASSLKVRIAASEAHTNSTVKSFKKITNIIYRTYQNDDLIVIEADKNQFILGIIQDSKNTLKDFIGFGCIFKPLIKIIQPLINNIWENSYSDTFHAAQKVKPEISKTTPIKVLTTAKPIVTTVTQFEKVTKKPKKEDEKMGKPPISVPSQIQEISKDDKRSIKTSSVKTTTPITPKPQIIDLKQKLKEKIDFLTVAQPQADDEAGVEINNAFTNLIQKLDNLKGDEFGKQLQNIADLILEKKGFSVTLHKIRSIINKFREKLILLDEGDKKEILEHIQTWKNKLF
ncbi:MAG: hypothetical protein JSV62_08165 [Promethearchaeota archaeon]|nr:MAG: hypothetical protein JSV62_08165 [Candidatus Lokiarchaeota archaeon]